MAVDPTSPLRPQLRKLEDELQDSLEEVCDAPPVDQINTGELIRIEETLAIAAEAAKEAVSIRRKLRSDGNRISAEVEMPKDAPRAEL